jgi:hypothetical protein
VFRPLQLCFAIMAISSHPALEHIPPLVYSTLRIVIALPLLLLSARLQVSEVRFSPVLLVHALGLLTAV